MTKATKAEERRLAQLLLIGFQGPEPGEGFWKFLETTPPGGVLLFKQNITGQDQLLALLQKIQRVGTSGGGSGLLVGIDQEGGRVARLTGDVGFPVFPSAKAIAEGPDPQTDAAHAARVTAKGLRELGVNMNFAPVLDVVTDPGNRVIGDRSFGSDPALVTRLGLAAIHAMQNEGVAATAKHFPGHGPTSVDSHLDLPRIDASREEMEAIHLRPFHAAVEAGVAAIMTAHAVYPALDPEAPATLSYPVLTGILRDEWGFEGVITTDSLTMQAIARRHTVSEACVLAFDAGADLLMVPASPSLQRECLGALCQAYAQGRISEDRLAASLARLDRMRRAFHP